MKKFLTILISLCLILPITVKADTEAKDLKETVESIGLTFKGTDYKETEDQVQIYLFRWTSCDHCHDAIEFFNDIVEEYGDKFKMRSFETSMNPENDAVRQRIVNFLKLKDSNGVPLIIVGESSFYGFSDSTKDKIIQAIKSEYDADEKYDIFEEMEKTTKEKMGNANTIMIVFLAAAIIVIVVIFVRKK